MMQRVLTIDTIEQLSIIAVPIRLQIIELIRERARSPKSLSRTLDKSAQNLNYHFSQLYKHGFIYRKYEEKKRGAFESFYQPVAHIIRIDGRLFKQKTSLAEQIFNTVDSFQLELNKSLNQSENPQTISVVFQSKKDLIAFLEKNTFTPTAKFQLNVIQT